MQWVLHANASRRTLEVPSDIEAEVINNSLRKRKNYITINKGSIDGIEEGMGVISNSGVVGKQIFLVTAKDWAAL